MLALTAGTFLTRPFVAVLQGLQDVVFCGVVGIAQTALTVGLTIGLVLVGRLGLVGLAVAATLPPLLGGVASAVRVAVAHRDALRPGRASRAGAWQLVREGFGPWLAGFGVRLLTGSTSVILVGLGRSVEAVLLASTMKAAQLLQNVAWVLPDSTLVGLSQLKGESPDRVRQTVVALLVMYLLLSGFMAFAVVAGNPALVRVWLGPDLYAGHAVNALVAANLVLGGLVTGLFKVVAVGGYRPAVGFATLVYGALTAAVVYALGRAGGLAWVAAGPVVTAAAFAIPVGLWLLPKVYGVSAREVVGWWLAWAVRSAPFLAAGGGLGAALMGRPAWAFAAAAAVGLAYLAVTRPLVAVVPWPAAARRILVRVRVVPAEPAGRSA
jgi:hypothetical protein